MARPESPLKSEAIAAILRLTATHGVKEGCRLAREQYRNVPVGSWGRWRLEAVGNGPQQRESNGAGVTALADELRTQIPKPEHLAAALEDPIPVARRALDFWRMLDELEDDARLLREFALARGSDGKTRVKAPFALRDAHRMRCDLIRLALQQAEVAHGVERAATFFQTVVDVIGEESPDCARRIMSRLHQVQTESQLRGF
jgi:hypothetical protein